MKYVNPLILDVFTSIPLNLWYPLIWWNSHLIFWHPFQNWLKFSFPHFIQDLIRLWCWLGAQELISNRLFRHAQIRLAELQNSSCMLSLADRSFPPCVSDIFVAPAPAHLQQLTPHPQHTLRLSDRPLPQTLGSDLLQLTFGCQSVNAWAAALLVMWQMIRIMSDCFP